LHSGIRDKRGGCITEVHLAQEQNVIHDRLSTRVISVWHTSSIMRGQLDIRKCAGEGIPCHADWRQSLQFKIKQTWKTGQ